MKIIFENTIEKNDTKALIKYGRSSLKFMLILLLFTFAIYFIFSLINKNADNQRLSGLGIIWCAAIYVYVFFIQPQISFRSFKRKYSSNAVIKFVFDKKNLEVTINGEFNKRKGYCNIFKVIETNDYFFVYFKRDEAFIAKKSGLTKGSLEDVSEILSVEMGTKYIRKGSSYGKV